MDDHQGMAAAVVLGNAADHRRGGPGGKGVFEEIMGIVALAADGDEQVSRIDGSGVDGNAACLPGRRRMAAGRGLDLGRVP